jgi:hypothetical protein
MTTQTKTRSYKREFLDKVKQKFYDLQSSNKADKDTTGITCNDKKRKECDTKGVAIRR